MHVAMASDSVFFAFVFALVVFGGSGVLVRFDRCNSQRILCLHVISTEDDVNIRNDKGCMGHRTGTKLDVVAALCGI